MVDMIRVAIVDDHEAVRVGLDVALGAEPGMVIVGAAKVAAEVAPLVHRTRPDVVVMDYKLDGTDGLDLCRHMKARPLPPAVLLHSAFAEDWLTVPAVLAGADGIVHKGAPGRELAAAIRELASGGSALPPVRPDLLRDAAEALRPDDQPILAMLVHGTSSRDV